MPMGKCARPHSKYKVRITVKRNAAYPQASICFSVHTYLYLAELPVTFKKKLVDVTVQEQDTIRLEVELSKPSTDVKWMKNGVVLQQGGNLEIHVEGVKQTLVLKSVAYADRGHYSCETLDDKTQAKLTVESRASFIVTLSQSYSFDHNIFIPYVCYDDYI